MDAIKVQQDYEFSIERETTFGTAVDTSPIGLPTENLVIEHEPDIHKIPRADGVRGEYEARRWQDTASTIPKASMGLVMTPQLMALMLPGILQKDVDWAAVTNVWTMYPVQYADLPAPRGDDTGYFFTLARRSPVANDSVRLAGAIPTDFKFTIHPTENDGVLFCDSNWIGASYSRKVNLSQNSTQASLVNLFKWGDIGLVKFTDYGSNEYTLTNDFLSAEINISYGAKFANDIPTGEVVFPLLTVSGNFKVGAGDNTEVMKDLVRASAINTTNLLQIQFGDGTVSTDGELNLDIYCYLSSHEDDYTEGENIVFGFEGVLGTTGQYPFQAEFFLT